MVGLRGVFAALQQVPVSANRWRAHARSFLLGLLTIRRGKDLSVCGAVGQRQMGERVANELFLVVSVATVPFIAMPMARTECERGSCRSSG